MDYKDKVFVVTGGGNGMGRELVLYLLSHGAKIVALDLNKDTLKETEKLAEQYKENISTYVIDITNKEQVEELPAKIIKKYKQIDGVINMAGIIQPFIKLNNLNFDKIERIINVNFYGTLYVTKTFLPYLLKNTTKSYLVNVSSMGGFLPVPGQSAYGASKAAVKLLTEGLYAELKDTNVQVSLVMPGAIGTNIAQNSGVEIKVDKCFAEKQTVLTPSKAAEIIMKGVEKGKLRILVGKDCKIMDFLYRLCPQKAINMIAKKMGFLLND